MPEIKRGEIWSANLEPQAHRVEPGKIRPVLILQSNALNLEPTHPSVIIVPGTTNIQELAPDDSFPMRVRVQQSGALRTDTDLLIDQIRAIAKSRLQERLTVVPNNILKRVLEGFARLTL